MKLPWLRCAALSILIAPLSAAQAGESWLCVEDKSVGFKYNGNVWDTANFFPTKYIVRPLVAGDFYFDPGSQVAQYGVFEFGETFPAAYVCKSGFSMAFGDQNVETSFAVCEGIGTFRIDKENLRFLRTYVAGYTYIPPDGVERNSDTPVIAIGKCSRIN